MGPLGYQMRSVSSLWSQKDTIEYLQALLGHSGTWTSPGAGPEGVTAQWVHCKAGNQEEKQLLLWNSSQFIPLWSEWSRRGGDGHPSLLQNPMLSTFLSQVCLSWILITKSHRNNFFSLAISFIWRKSGMRDCSCKAKSSPPALGEVFGGRDPLRDHLALLPQSFCVTNTFLMVSNGNAAVGDQLAAQNSSHEPHYLCPDLKSKCFSIHLATTPFLHPKSPQTKPHPGHVGVPEVLKWIPNPKCIFVPLVQPTGPPVLPRYQHLPKLRRV